MLGLSLTHYIKKARKKRVRDYFGISHITPPKVDRGQVLANPFPDSLYQRKLWALMGTFTDYMIRKMFRDGLVADNAEIVKEETLVSEHGWKMAIALSAFEKDDEVSDEVLSRGEVWIDAYRSKAWDSCLEEAFLMSQLDSIYRAGAIFPLHYLSSDEVEGLKLYLGAILDWLQSEFRDARYVILNPLYGHSDVCKADGDIVIDNTLYEIKTTKNPVPTVRREMEQLLGYIALAWYHREHPEATSPPVVEYESVGYLLPQSLAVYRTDIGGFTVADKKMYCEKISELRADEVGERGEPRSSDIVKQLVKKGDWDGAVTKVKELLHSGLGTLTEWQILLKGLAEDGQLERVLMLAKVLEENEENLKPWKPIFPTYTEKDGKMVLEPNYEYRHDFYVLYFNIGIALAKEGDPQFALHCFDLFLKRSGLTLEDFPTAAIYMSLLQARLGNNEASEELWTIARTEPELGNLKKTIRGLIDEQRAKHD